MTNMIRSARDQAAALTQAAYERAAAAGALPAGAQVKAAIEIPKDTAHGDCASSFAMAGAKVLRMAPRTIAQAIADRLEPEGSYFNKVEIAGPGFLNFSLGPKWYGDVLSAIEAQGASYGSGDEGAGKKVLVELPSADPTGPASLNSARGVVLGETLANLLARNGWEVRKELRAGDAGIARHRNQLEIREFDKVIRIREAGRHGSVDGLEPDGSRRFVTVLVQPVNLLRDGKPARTSQRTGKAFTLHDLLDEISVDAARYYFSSRASSSPLDLDLDLAVRQDGGNPVYRVRYAHARICSLLSRMAESGAAVCPASQVDASVLTAPEELALIKSLAQYPEELHLAARDCDPSRVNRCLTALAGDFRRFYNACRRTVDDTTLQAARLKLADATRSVLANGLNLLGVTAPEKM